VKVTLPNGNVPYTIEEILPSCRCKTIGGLGR
jgi:hypothetical protein